MALALPVHPGRPGGAPGDMTEARSFTSVVFATDGKRMVNLYRNPVPCYDVAMLLVALIFINEIIKYACGCYTRSHIHLAVALIYSSTQPVVENIPRFVPRNSVVNNIQLLYLNECVRSSRRRALLLPLTLLSTSSSHSLVHQ